MDNVSSKKHYQRFAVIHRMLHIVAMASFIILAITGFSLYFSSQGWAKAFVYLMGGAQNAGSLHRFFATLFYIGVMIHIIWIGYFKLVLKGKLLGPQSMLPTRQDVQDLYQNFRYIFGKGAPPAFNRFSYLEKIDYWAVLLGMQSMGITGLILWYPEFFSNFFPGYIINVANAFHIHEAILAVVYIGFVHMSATHLTPEVFPIEKSIFTGRTTAIKIQETHPGEWESWIADNQKAADYEKN